VGARSGASPPLRLLLTGELLQRAINHISIINQPLDEERNAKRSMDLDVSGRRVGLELKRARSDHWTVARNPTKRPTSFSRQSLFRFADNPFISAAFHIFTG
jgi:hypothetical protein